MLLISVTLSASTTSTPTTAETGVTMREKGNVKGYAAHLQVHCCESSQELTLPSGGMFSLRHRSQWTSPPSFP